MPEQLVVALKNAATEVSVMAQELAWLLPARNSVLTCVSGGWTRRASTHDVSGASSNMRRKHTAAKKKCHAPFAPCITLRSEGATKAWSHFPGERAKRSRIGLAIRLGQKKMRNKRFTRIASTRVHHPLCLT